MGIMPGMRASQWIGRATSRHARWLHDQPASRLALPGPGRALALRAAACGALWLRRLGPLEGLASREGRRAVRMEARTSSRGCSGARVLRSRVAAARSETDDVALTRRRIRRVRLPSRGPSRAGVTSTHPSRHRSVGRRARGARRPPGLKTSALSATALAHRDAQPTCDFTPGLRRDRHPRAFPVEGWDCWGNDV